MAVDFSKLLSVKADDVVKPEPLPGGTYYGLIKSYSFIETQTQNKTPAARIVVVLNEAGEDVDADDLAAAIATMGDGGLSSKTHNYDFWLTADALWRVVEFLQGLGISTEGRTIAECMPEINGQSIMASGARIQSKKNAEEFFFNLTNIAPRA